MQQQEIQFTDLYVRLPFTEESMDGIEGTGLLPTLVTQVSPTNMSTPQTKASREMSLLL